MAEFSFRLEHNMQKLVRFINCIGILIVKNRFFVKKGLKKQYFAVVKISASVFAQSDKAFEKIASDMDKIGVHYLHIDCKSNEQLDDFLTQNAAVNQLPFDIHLISGNAPIFDPRLTLHTQNRICLQLENIGELPAHFFDYPVKKGVAITTATQLSSLQTAWLEKLDFVMLMCTVPGESGGQFDKINFQRINQLKQLYPKIKITIDGGVNSEVAFILKLLDVDTVVSGSYLMKQNEYGANMLSLLHPVATDSIKVIDFMLPVSSCPTLESDSFSFLECVQAIDNGKQGFVLIKGKTGKLSGVATNADIRKALIAHWENLAGITPHQYINSSPFVINQNMTVKEMLKTIEEADRVILFLPVINDNDKLVGVVPLNHLAKG